MSSTQHHHLDRVPSAPTGLDPRLGASSSASAVSAAASSSLGRSAAAPSSSLPPLHSAYSNRPLSHHSNHLASRQYDGLHHDPPHVYNPTSPQQSPNSYYHYSPVNHAGGHTSQPQRDSQSVSNGQPSPSGGPFAPTDRDVSPENVGENGPVDDPKRPRACEGCRGLKVRCDQDPAHPEIPCKRCAKAGRECIITQPSRKRQKKSDSRVAELEKKLDALTQVLQQQVQPRQGPASYQTSYTSFDGPSPSAAVNSDGSMSSLPPMQHNQSLRAEHTHNGNKRPLPIENHTPVKRRPTEDISEISSIDHIRERQQQARSSESETYSRRSEEPVNTELTRASEQLYPEPGVKPYNSASWGEEFIKGINQIVDPETGTLIFNRYVTKLAPNLPAVVFPHGTTAEQIRREKPILYVCILSASCGRAVTARVSAQLAIEAVGALADCVVRQGAKSLELIQAMQVMAIWYKPPDKAEQTNFYQIIHMSAVMALDVGLGKRFNSAKARRGFAGSNATIGPPAASNVSQDSDTLEARRAWLVCYYLCATASNVLRRPNLLRWTHYMQECIEVLESHPDAYSTDKLLCQFVKIQHICEDIGRTFLMDDSSANISITDPKVTYALNVLESQLKSWKEKIPAECRDSTLQFFEHCTSLYLHEIALHFNHNVEDFRMPFTEESLKSVNNTSDTLTQHQISALAACLKAAHGMLDTILSWDVQFVSGLPMLMFFIRCTYALVVLIKMHVAITSPGSELGKMLRAEDLRVELYMDRLVTLFEYVALDIDSTPKPKVARILCTLRDWFKKHREKTLASRLPTPLRQRPLISDPSQQPLQQNSALEQQHPHSTSSLHLLSQVAAAGNQIRDYPSSQTSSTSPLDHTKHPHATANANGTSVPTTESDYSNWSYADPLPVPCNRVNKYLRNPGYPVTETSGAASRAPPTSVDHFFPAAQHHDPSSSSADAAVNLSAADFGWGTGFEQAMDMAMGGMDALAAGGLDGWFLGEGVAPFTLAAPDLDHAHHQHAHHHHHHHHHPASGQHVVGVDAVNAGGGGGGGGSGAGAGGGGGARHGVW